MNAKDLKDSWRAAISAGKTEMVWLVEFQDPAIVVEMRVRPGKMG